MADGEKQHHHPNHHLHCTLESTTQSLRVLYTVHGSASVGAGSLLKPQVHGVPRVRDSETCSETSKRGLARGDARVLLFYYWNCY